MDTRNSSYTGIEQPNLGLHGSSITMSGYELKSVGRAAWGCAYLTWGT